MKPTTYTIKIAAEQNTAVLVKILSAISRRLLPIISFKVHLEGNENLFLIEFTFEDLEENILKFSNFLDKQVDIIAVSFIKHQTESEC
jgi:acetolactate synthase regulatory subunit